MKLYSSADMAYAEVTLSEDYQIKEFNRRTEQLEYLLMLVIVVAFTSTFSGMLVYAIGEIAYYFIKENKDKKKKQENKEENTKA